MRSSSVLISSSFLLLALHFHFTNAINFYIENKCSYTVWAAAISGGGQQLDPGQTWTLDTNPTHIWGRTNCNFDESGQGSCLTGDCNGRLECQSEGAPPYTLAKYGSDMVDDNRDNFFISLEHGFNVPMEIRPTDPDQCTVDVVRCTADINGQCPEELKAPGGCNDPCTVFKTEDYCCNDIKGTCEATDYSKFFKDQCPDASTIPGDDVSSCFEFTTDYRVVFCP